jgi:hypothetical protein
MAFSKVTSLKLVNAILGIVALVQLVTVVTFAFFSESIPFDRIKIVHITCGLTLLALIIVHIFLNWTWVKSNFFKKMRR